MMMRIKVQPPPTEAEEEDEEAKDLPSFSHSLLLCSVCVSRNPLRAVAPQTRRP